MWQFIITESETDLISHAGLGLIGLALNEHTDLAADTKGVSSLRYDAVSHANILSGFVALLCLGQSDFEAINRFREGTYFTEALGLERVPSEGILHQRMDAHAAGYKVAVEEAIEFPHRRGAHFTPLDDGLVPLDCDVTPFDNSKRRKRGLTNLSGPRRLRTHAWLIWAGKATVWSGSYARAASLVRISVY